MNYIDNKTIYNISDLYNAPADRSTSRGINRKILLDAIYKSDGVYRAALAKSLGLSKPAVADNVADLIETGLVEERGLANAGKSGGRRPTMLYFNNTFKYIGAIDLSLHEPVCAIGDLSYQLVGLKKIKTSKYAPAEEKRKCIIETLASIMRENSIPSDMLWGIVVSHPGIINENNELVYTVEQFRPWTQIDIKPHLEQHFNVPVILENDVRLAAMGELQVGLQNKLSDLIYVSCGTGLAASIIIGGKLYEGQNRASGEMGSMVDNDGKRREDTVAMYGMLEYLEGLLASDGRKDRLDFSSVVEMAAFGDDVINQGIREIGRQIGRIIYNTSILLDIPTIIFGGDYLKLGQALFDGLEDAIPQSHYLPRPQIIKSTMKESAGIFGAFSLGTNAIIQQTLNTC